MKLVMFSKHLAPLSIEQAAKTAGELGFEGLDLTVRPGGHIEPEQALEALPAAVKMVRDLGYDIPMITTAITNASAPYSEDIFRAALAEKYEVRANLHIHSGDFITADGAVVWHILHGRDPDLVGAYIDPGHMAAEGGMSGWKMGMDLLTPWINLVAIKDMAWIHNFDETLGKERWSTRLVPLKQGLVPWPEVFEYLHDIGFDGTISVHSEYQGSHSWRDLNLDELLVQTKEDLDYLKGVIASVWR